MSSIIDINPINNNQLSHNKSKIKSCIKKFCITDFYCGTVNVKVPCLWPSVILIILVIIGIIIKFIIDKYK